MIFEVRVRIPKNSNFSDVALYIEDAVKTHCGGLHPEEALFHLERDTVRVLGCRSEGVDKMKYVRTFVSWALIAAASAATILGLAHLLYRS